MSEENKEQEVSTEQAVEETTEATETAETAPAPRRVRRKWPIVVAVVIVVLIAAGIGFFIWHEQPSFCNAICHTPMDPYLPTYESEIGQSAIDKWGNEADPAAMLAPIHRTVAQVTCLGCHVPTLSEQIGEGIGWVTGNYEVVPNDTYGGVLIETDLEQLTAARGIEPDQFCLNENCHNITREDLIQQTADYERNPHVPQHGEIECSSCHKAHRASVNYCSSCHADAPIPEGWLTVAESDALTNKAMA